MHKSLLLLSALIGFVSPLIPIRSSASADFFVEIKQVARNQEEYKLEKDSSNAAPPNVPQLFEEASEAYQAENYLEAEVLLRRILELNPDTETKATVYEKLGIVLYEIGQAQEALLSLDNARGLLPERIESLEDLTPYTDLASSFRPINQFRESIKVIRQAITLNPYIANAAHCDLMVEIFEASEIPAEITKRQYRSARCELEFSLLDDSGKPLLLELETRIEPESNNRNLQTKYAAIYTNIGLEELARPYTLFHPAYLNEKLNEAHAIAHLNLGIELLNRAVLLGDSVALDEVVSSFQTSLEKDRSYSWNRVYLSISLLAQERLDEAILLAQQVLKQPSLESLPNTPTNTHAWAHTILGYALELQGRPREAMAEYRISIQLERVIN